MNIALIEHGEPALGVVLAPALRQAFGGARALGASQKLTDGGIQSPAGARPRSD